MLSRHIAEDHIVEFHITPEFPQLRPAARLLRRKLPREMTGVLRDFFERSIFFQYIAEGHIALVRLRLGLHQIEDPLCPGKSRQNLVNLGRKLVHRQGALAHKHQIG